MLMIVLGLGHNLLYQHTEIDLKTPTMRHLKVYVDKANVYFQAQFKTILQQMQGAETGKSGEL